MRDILLAASPTIPADSLRLCKDVGLPNELLSMEERQVIRSYKFGLVYIAPEQTTEEEMFANSWGVSLEDILQLTISRTNFAAVSRVSQFLG